MVVDYLSYANLSFLIRRTVRSNGFQENPSTSQDLIEALEASEKSMAALVRGPKPQLPKRLLFVDDEASVRATLPLITAPASISRRRDCALDRVRGAWGERAGASIARTSGEATLFDFATHS